MHVPVVQLVWDTKRSGLGSLNGDDAVRVDQSAGWGPSSLLALAASSGLMTAFLELADAAGLPVLGYVSAAYLQTTDPENAGAPAVRLVPCITVASDAEVEGAELLLRTAAAVSPVVRCLGGHVVIEPDIQVLPLSEDACAM